MMDQQRPGDPPKSDRVRTFVVTRHEATPAAAHEVRARRLLLADWGLPEDTLFHRLMAYGRDDETLVLELADVGADGQVHFAPWHEVPTRKEWPTGFRGALYGVPLSCSLTPEPPVIGLTRHVEVPFHVLRMTGRYRNSRVYVELRQHPDGCEGPDLRGQETGVTQDEVLRAWRSIELLRKLTRPGPGGLTTAEKRAYLDEYERHILALRGPGFPRWKLTQKRLKERTGYARSTMTGHLEQCLGLGYWGRVQAWLRTLPPGKKLTPEELTPAQRLRHLVS